MQMLRELDILDSAAEKAFDHIARMGQRLFHVPICLVTLVDTSRQWFKGEHGAVPRPAMPSASLPICASIRSMLWPQRP